MYCVCVQDDKSKRNVLYVYWMIEQEECTICVQDDRVRGMYCMCSG